MREGVADIDIPVLILGIDLDTTNDQNNTQEETNQIQLNLE